MTTLPDTQARALAERFYEDAPKGWEQERDDAKSKQMWLEWAAQLIAVEGLRQRLEVLREVRSRYMDNRGLDDWLDSRIAELQQQRSPEQRARRDVEGISAPRGLRRNPCDEPAEP